MTMKAAGRKGPFSLFLDPVGERGERKTEISDIVGCKTGGVLGGKEDRESFGKEKNPKTGRRQKPKQPRHSVRLAKEVN